MADDWDWVLWLFLGLAVGVIISRAPQPSLSPTQIRMIQPSPAPPPQRVDTYHNDEEWEIITDRQGRVTGVKGKRRAEQVKG